MWAGLCRGFKAVSVVAIFLTLTWYAFSALGEDWTFVDTMVSCNPPSQITVKILRTPSQSPACPAHLVDVLAMLN